jgi:LacI family transcriptional regulator
VAHKRVTLADVARSSGVSSPTASLVLSGRGAELRISDAVQQRVRAVAASLGYRPNIASIGLRKGTTRTLGFVSDTVATSQLAGDMIKGALEAARERGFMLFIGEDEGDAAVERQLLDAMLDRQVDGIILASMYTQRRKVPTRLEQVPAVLLNALPQGRRRGVPVVVPDELEAGRAAARLLLRAGHRRIHLVGAGPTPDDVPEGGVAAAERLAGILEVLAAEGLEPASGRLYPVWHPPEGYDAMQRVLDDDPGSPTPPGVITFNDRVAMGVYQALQERGLRVPTDAGVVSFDDHPIADWLRPGLTTFAIPHHELGRRAVHLLLDAVGSGPPARAATYRVPMPLRLRGSVDVPDR